VFHADLLVFSIVPSTSSGLGQSRAMLSISSVPCHQKAKGVKCKMQIKNRMIYEVEAIKINSISAMKISG
jgi:hypothetical protein